MMAAEFSIVRYCRQWFQGSSVYLNCSDDEHKHARTSRCAVGVMYCQLLPSFEEQVLTTLRLTDKLEMENEERIT